MLQENRNGSETGEGALNRGVLRGGPMVAGVEVSVVTSEAHELSATVSKFALESGAAVSDHIIQSPDAVTVNCEVSNAGDGPQRARDMLEALKSMKEAGKLLELATEHALYKDMAIVSLSPLHAAPHKGKLQCTVKLEQVSRVQLRVVGRQPGTMAGKEGKTMAPQKNGGTQETEPVSDESGVYKYATRGG